MNTLSRRLPALLVLIWMIPAWAWSPLVDQQPALDHSHGIFGNPAALGSYDGPGWLLTFTPDTAQAQMLRLGVHSENLGFSMRWLQDKELGIDHSFWHGTISIPSPENLFFVGLRGTLWRSSEFRGNAWSATPGLLTHPFRWLSLGWSGENWLANKEFSKRHLYGISIRPIDPIILSTDLRVDHYNKNWQKESPVVGQVDLLISGVTLGARIPIRHAESEPYSMYLSAPLGGSQSLGISSTRDGIQSFGIDGHFAQGQNPLASPRWVRIELSSPLSEYKDGFLFFADDALSLPEFLMQIDHLEKNPSIQGIVFDFDGYSGNSAASQEIRKAIQRVKNKGKRTLAYLTQLRPGSLLAASAAERIAIQPSSQIHFRGLSLESTHYKGFLDRIGVRAELIRHGRYKSAVEPYTRDSISPEARSNYESLIGSLWSSLRDSISNSRHMSPSKLDSIASLSPLSASEAQSLGLVDTLLQYDDIPAYLKISSIAPWKSLSRPPFRTDWNSRPKIAVITLDGDIVDGAGNASPFGRSGVGAKSYSELIDYLRSSPSIVGLVLRIHSPGGSAQASEMLWHRFRRLGKDLGIPIVASVGGMAASGGYYIACAAEEIYAEPTSIVGSIGIFGGKIDISGLMDKLKINSSVVRTHEKSDAERISRPFSEVERQIVQKSMDEAYVRFVAAVSEARGLSPEQVDKIGEGQVFSGIQAVQNGLVDKVGGLEHAIRSAATRAGYPETQELQTLHIHFRSGWNVQQGRVASYAMGWLESWFNRVEDTKVWAMWNGPDYLED